MKTVRHADRAPVVGWSSRRLGASCGGLALVALVALVACTAEEDSPGLTRIDTGGGGRAANTGGAGGLGGRSSVAGTGGATPAETGGTGGSLAAGQGGTSAGGASGLAGESGTGGGGANNGGKGGTGGGQGGIGVGGTGGTGGAANGAGKGGTGGDPGTAGAGGQPEPPDPTLAEVHPSGRYLSVAGGLRSSWSGSSLTTTFEGTGLSVTFEAANSTTDYEVIVDGQRLVANKIELVSGEKTYPVVTGLPAGQHTATVHRRTEASTGAVVFKGFTVTGGALVPTPSPFAHRIEFVGDSITCGYGTECKTATEAFSTKTENHWLTFGAGASRLLAADGHFISWSGKGMVNNYGNDQSPRMPELFPRTYGAEATPLWDFAAWKPEVVVINLGTNDWNGGIDTATEIESFKTAYRAFIDELALRYPGVVVFGIGNAIVGKSHTEAVKAVMEGYASPSRRYLLFSVKSAEGSGCYHPSAATHARWADELAAAIQDATGW